MSLHVAYIIGAAAGLVTVGNGVTMLRRPATYRSPAWPSNDRRFIRAIAVAGPVVGALMIIQSLFSAFSE
ncbi:hypothetical protein ASE95_13905 [Sphingomonas sp. Leaf231]|uniref:hypothetical protein n=1 Tax=Sphingomonas sp. Leaf231 TaxID=1736301 RepID=UPI0006F5FA4D|nr:hypothetical protein [Sphingomonas sp. Leaf231]KQN90555.1 hypothetical protein ASE95_13905 [Sphingomonas sp. Leaf231]